MFTESFEATLSAYGKIDIVVNNAGIMNDRFWELEVDINLVSKKKLLLFIIKINLKNINLCFYHQNGVIRGTLLAQRYLGIDRGYGGGVVVNTGSNCSINPYVSVPIYSATKSAIVSLTRAFGVSFQICNNNLFPFIKKKKFCHPSCKNYFTMMFLIEVNLIKKSF